MKIYFTFSNIPELAGLTPLQRKLVYRCGLEACFADEPSVMWDSSRWLFGGLLGGALAGWLLLVKAGLAGAFGLNHPVFVTIIPGLVATGVVNCVATHFLHVRLRPYLQRVLEERKDEIAQIK